MWEPRIDYLTDRMMDGQTIGWHTSFSRIFSHSESETIPPPLPLLTTTPQINIYRQSKESMRTCVTYLVHAARDHLVQGLSHGIMHAPVYHYTQLPWYPKQRIRGATAKKITLYDCSSIFGMLQQPRLIILNGFLRLSRLYKISVERSKS